MGESVVFPIYIVVKYLAYCGWCYCGLRLLRERASMGSAIGFGSARLGLGIVFGVGIFFVGAFLHLNVPAHPWLMYLSVYAPVRYVEWTILAALVIAGENSTRRVGDAVAQRWILGGIVVSHLADFPLILSSHKGPQGFLPVGRFLC